MSLLHLMPAFVGNPTLQVFNLTDYADITHVASSATATAGIWIRGDGTVDENIGGTSTQIFPLSDWAIPNGAFTGYYVRMTQNSGDTLAVGSDTLSTWLALTSDRQWLYERAASGVDTGTFTVDIASDAGGTDIVATGNYTMYAENDTT